MAQRWTYYAFDTMTMQLMAELPFSKATFNRTLNDCGDFDGEIQIADPFKTGANILNATRPGRTNLFIDLDGSIVWSGFIWSREYDEETETLKIGGKEIWSYWQRRMQDDYTNPPGSSGEYWQTNPATTIAIGQQVIYDKSYDVGSGICGPIIVGTDMANGTNYTTISLTDSYHATPVPSDIASGTILYLCYNSGEVQAVELTANANQGDTSLTVASFTPVRNILGTSLWESYAQSTPIAVCQVVAAVGWPLQMRLESAIDTSHGSPATIDGSYPRAQLQTVEAIIRQHTEAGVGIGFDLGVECFWVAGPGGPVTCAFTCYFPIKGQDASLNGINGRMLDLATATTYTWAEDAFSQASVVYAVGQAAAQIESIQTSSYVEAEGYPLTEELFPFIEVNTQSQLDSAAEGALSQYAWPVAAPKVTVQAMPPAEPYLGGFALGDTLRVFQSRQRVPASFFPGGLETQLRVVDIAVTVPDDGLATMELTLNIPPVLDPPPPVGLGL